MVEVEKEEEEEEESYAIKPVLPTQDQSGKGIEAIPEIIVLAAHLKCHILNQKTCIYSSILQG